MNSLKYLISAALTLITFGLQVVAQPCIKLLTPQRNCINQQVRVTWCNAGPVKYFYRSYLSGTNPSPVTTPFTQVGGDNIYTVQFGNPGKYTIEVLENNLTSSLEVEILPKPKPVFELFSCKGRTARIVLKDTTYDKFLITFFPENKVYTVYKRDTILNHVFADTLPGKAVLISGLYMPANCGGDAVTTVTVFNTLPTPNIKRITINKLSADSGTADIEFEVSRLLKYYVFYADSSKQLLTIESTNGLITRQLERFNTLNIPKLLFEVNSYCDPSGGAMHIPLPYNTLAKANPGFIKLTWAALASNSKLKLINYRVNKSYGLNSETINVKASQLEYIDSLVSCSFAQYIYRIEALYITTTGNDTFFVQGPALIVSPLSKNAPLAVTYPNVTVLPNNTISLSWDKLPDTITTRFRVLRSIYPDSGFAQFQILANQTNNSRIVFNDSSANILDSARYYYKIDYLDNCLTRSPSSPKLSASKLECKAIDHINKRLNWINPLGWENRINEINIEYMNTELGEPYNFLSVSAPRLSYNDQFYDTVNQTINYRITYISTDSVALRSSSNVCKITQKSFLLLPTAFSPNGDGINDTYAPLGQHIKTIDFRVINRWGEVLFSSQSMGEGWDGTINGNKAPIDTYLGVVKATDKVGVELNKQSSFVIIK